MPQTPFDMAYGTSMLPSQLLMGSPFMQSPMVPMPPSAGSRINHVPYTPMLSNTPVLGHIPDTARQRGYKYQMQQMKEPLKTRSVLISNLPSSISEEKFLDCVSFGPVESCHFVDLDTKSGSVVLSFLNHQTAQDFFSDASNSHELAVKLGAPHLAVSWTASSAIPSSVKKAVEENPATTRAVFVSYLECENLTQDDVLEKLQDFGPIESVETDYDRKHVTCNYTCISHALEAIKSLKNDSSLQRAKVFHAKDRCCSAPTDSFTDSFSDEATATATATAAIAGDVNMGNRTVYLGNLHPETPTEKICNIVRGGLLHTVRRDKYSCFVTFIEPLAAAQFFATASMEGLYLLGRRLKVGWGKHSGPLPNNIALAVTAGASRNVYIGSVSDSLVPQQSELWDDFSKYGEIEQINFFKDNKCAFVNYTSIASAIRLVDELNGSSKAQAHAAWNNKYLDYKIAFGKDRCGNPPKSKRRKPSYHHEPKDQDPSNETQKDNASLFAGMGISSLSLKEEETNPAPLGISCGSTGSFYEKSPEPVKFDDTSSQSRLSQTELFDSRSSCSEESSVFKESRQIRSHQRLNHFTTTGSEVMAQYLAQAQHNNLFYAAAILNAHDDEEFSEGFSFV